MLAFIESFNKFGSLKNVLERKKLKSRNHGITELRSFLVRYRRTYVLNDTSIKHILRLSLRNPSSARLPRDVWQNYERARSQFRVNRGAQTFLNKIF